MTSLDGDDSPLLVDWLFVFVVVFLAYTNARTLHKLHCCTQLPDWLTDFRNWFCWIRFICWTIGLLRSISVRVHCSSSCCWRWRWPGQLYIYTQFNYAFEWLLVCMCMYVLLYHTQAEFQHIIPFPTNSIWFSIHFSFTALDFPSSRGKSLDQSYGCNYLHCTNER